jgi:peptidyl-Asp metalloendopeptidase
LSEKTCNTDHKPTHFTHRLIGSANVMNPIKKIIHALCVMVLLSFSSVICAAQTVVDVLVVYTKGAADLYAGDPSTRINQVIQFTNQIYADSGLDLQLRIADSMMVDYTDANTGVDALKDITYSQHAAFETVSARRQAAKADMVILYRAFNTSQNSCGEAWIGGMNTQGDFSDSELKSYMYAHVPINVCGDDATAHELGHNMGLRHSRKQDGEGGTFAFALGYGEVNKFTTVMAYQSAFNVDYWTGKVYKFSSPDLDCKGQPCGVDRNDQINGADSVYSISVTAPQIAAYYGDSLVQSSSSQSSSSNSLSSSSASSSLSSSSSSSSSSVANTGMAPNPVVTNTASTQESSGGGGGSLNFMMLLFLLVIFFRKSLSS